MRIDAHQHFWKFEPVRDSWINEDMQVIRRDFLPADLEPLLKESGIAGCITVQTDQSETDNDFMLGLAEENDFIKGVVGWVDLQAPNIRERLGYYNQFTKVKGFRHVLQSEKDEAFMLRDTFRRGIAALESFNYTYDILIYPNHLANARKLVKDHPHQAFVIDHLAKPYIRERKIDEWRRNLLAVAEHENVYCKVSGMVTEADWKTWKQPELKPYIETVFEAFGTARVLFGSDWPVCLLAATYREVAGIVEDYTRHLSDDEQAAVWGGNAQRFYHLT